MRYILLLTLAAMTTTANAYPSQTTAPSVRPPQPPVAAQEAPRPFPRGQAPIELRWHYSSVRADGRPFYVVTFIRHLTDEVSDEVALVKDWKGESWRLRVLDDFARQTVVHEIAHLPSGEYVRLSFKLPLKAKTRMEAIAEAHPQIGDKQSPIMTTDPPITIATRLVSRTAAESEWKNRELSADWRSDVRTSLSTLFLDGIERMRETLIRHGRGLESFGDTLLPMLSHSGPCESTNTYSKIVELPPDCDFDKELGRPCSEKQEKRIEEAAKKGIPLKIYY